MKEPLVAKEKIVNKGSMGEANGYKLQELYVRAKTSLEKFHEALKDCRLYVDYTIAKLENAFELRYEAREQLKEFKCKLIRLLAEAEIQGLQKLTKLVKALEGNDYFVRKFGKTIRVYPYREKWFASISGTAFTAPIHRVSTITPFPNIFKDMGREELEELALGWRASDETYHNGMAAMGTTSLWQLISWCAVRYGRFQISITRIVLTRKSPPSLVWSAVSLDHVQRLSRKEAWARILELYSRGKRLPLLTLYLGDGIVEQFALQNKRLRLSIAVKKELLPPNGEVIGYWYNYQLIIWGKKAQQLAREIIADSKEYGKLLDLLKSPKWTYLKSLAEYKRTRNPWRITINGIKWTLTLAGKGVYAYINCKTKEELQDILDILHKNYLSINYYNFGRGYRIYLSTRALMEIAKRDPNVKSAIMEFLWYKARYGKERVRIRAQKQLQKFQHL